MGEGRCADAVADQEHPFVDGNKRRAATTTGIFLEFNGQRLTTTKDEVLRSAIKTAEEQPEVDQIPVWLKAHSAAA